MTDKQPTCVSCVCPSVCPPAGSFRARLNGNATVGAERRPLAEDWCVWPRPFRHSCCQRQMMTTAHGLYGNSDWSRADLADPVAIGQEIIQHIRHSRGVGQGGACGRANFFFYRDYYVYLYVESVRNERSRSCLLRPAVGDDSGRRGASSPSNGCPRPVAGPAGPSL